MTDRNPDTLPTRRDPSGKCPRCGRTANFEVSTTFPLRTRMGERSMIPTQEVTVLQCHGCQEYSVVIETATDGRGPLHGVLWWPSDHLADIEQDAGVPQEITDAFSEAVRCISVQSPNAGAAMLRTTVALIVKDKGSPAAQQAGTLNNAINQMVTDRTLFQDFGDWAHHIRKIGNAGAHGEAFDPVDMDQADELKEFTRQLIAFLYEQPARFSAARQATKKSTSPTASPSGAPATQSGPTGTNPGGQQ